jgi:hypothetical protein
MYKTVQASKTGTIENQTNWFGFGMEFENQTISLPDTNRPFEYRNRTDVGCSIYF